MALSRDRIINPGHTPHAHEREGYEFVVAELPDNDPYRLWAFVDLLDRGRRYEIDLLVLGYHALYVIEMKGHPGALEGNEVDWQFTFPDGGRTVMENPLRGTNHKAKVLASLLEAQFRKDPASRNLRPPWVHPLVFLSHPELRTERLAPPGRINVVTRATLKRALARGEFPGAPEFLQNHTVNRPTGVATHRALNALGLRPSISALKVEGLLLRELLEDGSYYQDHLGVHESVAALERRVRSYPIPTSTTAERRDQFLRAASREAKHLTALSDHRSVLRLVGYVADGPLGGPCVILEHFADALPLDAFLRANPSLPFEHRLAIIQQVGEALEFCHRKQIFHRGLNPRAILVRQRPGEDGKLAPPEVRLYNFQIASTEDTTGTAHLTSLTQEQATVYIAPEVLRDPTVGDACSDVFSLGALAYFVFTGRSPGTSLTERNELLEQGHLSIAAVRDDLAGGAAARSLDEVVALATKANPLERADSAFTWLELLLDAATARTPDPDDGFADPLAARPGERLSSDVQVIAVLGSGSTARALRVARDGTEYALKVSLSPDLDERLRSEARVLEALRSDRIVSLAEELTLGKRVCLLMTDAGESLASLIAREGPPSLDFARRWGEDLLRALEALEDKGVQHRDIKPANVGVLPGQAKKKRNLLLFDFSLAGVPDTVITAGTPVYRDPFLERRGRWDAAADRWAAAMTLHELLTGARPRWAGEDAVSVARQLTIAAERFDTNVRARLVAFFRRALAADVAERFDSAEKMRVEWVKATHGDVAPEAAAVANPPDYGALDVSTPVAALPLSPRAKNALDRAGMTALGELLQMPRNRLSTARGIGRITHQEILQFIDGVRTALGSRLALADEAPFCPEYTGAAVPVGLVPGLPLEAAVVLEDAGLGQVQLVSTAPRGQVERVLSAHGGAAKILHGFMKASTAEISAAPGAPTSIEDWVEHLLGTGNKRPRFLQTAAQIFGLFPAPGQPAGWRPEDVRGLAQALDLTPAAIHIAFGKARDRWREHPHLALLEAALTEALSTLGGVAPLPRVAEALTAVIPHRPGTAPASPDIAAEAVARMAAETSERVMLGRIDRRLWLATGQASLAVARELGTVADDLAQTEPLPSAEQVRAGLAAVVTGTPLAALPSDRLVSLAADASRKAARSARLELYPRRMPAPRAVLLSAGAFPSHNANDEAIRRIVLARYPDAEPPPGRPALDELLRPLGLEWDPGRAQYVRPGLAAATAPGTVQPRRLTTTHTSHRPPPRTREAREAVEFDATLRLTAEKRDFRVLDVTAGYDQLAAEELVLRTRGRRVSLEREMLEETERLMAELGAEPEVVFQADRDGPANIEDWKNLRLLVRDAGYRVLERLFPAVAVGKVEPPQPLILTEPGVLARYGLEEVVAKLIERAGADHAPTVLLVNPTDEAAPPATIDGVPRPLAIPLTSPAKRLKVPEAWIRNLHRGGAA